MKEYKYFSNVNNNAAFSNDKCQFCGTKTECLDGVYFERPNLNAICLNCLDKKREYVEIPDYLTNQIKKDKDKKVNILRYTPPVPWIQYNDWPVCCDDFMVYIGEWKKEDFGKESENGNGIDLFKRILSEDTKNKVDDFDVLWNDLGKYTAAFVFECSICHNRRVVCQSY